MITIDRVRIRGFRSLKILEMPLGRNCVLIGPNNSGKTTVLKALQLALTDELTAHQEDFHRKAGCLACEQMTVDVRFVPVREDGGRGSVFSPHWRKAFGHDIVLDRYQREYVAIRARYVWDGALNLARKERLFLENWERGRSGKSIEKLPDCIRFVSIEAEESLRDDLLNPDSFISRACETLAEDLRVHPQYAQAPIENLREVLDRMCETLEGPGAQLPEGVALTAANIGHFFQMVRADSEELNPLSALQGKGSQKSVMILSTIIMIEMLVRQAKAHEWPLFVMITAEEPETHLHPNAQRSLMAQLAALSHQLLVTTHSPAVVSVCEPHELRSMLKIGDRIDVRWVPKNMDPMDVRMIKRMILRLRSDVLFARGLILVEGVTEEQLIRGMFHAYFGDDPSAFGISIIGVDGKSYAPFLMLAMSLRKPFVVVSDNDGDTEHVVHKQIAEVEKKAQYTYERNDSGLFFLSKGLAIEGELVYHTKLRREIIDALLACSAKPDQSAKNRRLKRYRFNRASDRELRHRLEKKKAEYSGFLGDIILMNPYGQAIDDMIPVPIRGAFEKIRQWLNVKRNA